MQPKGLEKLATGIADNLVKDMLNERVNCFIIYMEV